MDRFFNPKGIAVFGISPSPKNLARTVLQNLVAHRYQGTLVGIGSKRDTIFGVAVYPSLSELEIPIDLAVLVTPAPTVLPLLQECHSRGIERAIIMTAGFEEFKGPHDPLSAKLTTFAAETGLRFFGPNCQGVINSRLGLCLPFGLMPPEKLSPGDISVISQSGSISYMSGFFLSHELSGVNKVASIGNKMNVDEVDLLPYLFEDETTRLIVLHLESTERGRELFALLAKSPKPVILLKSQIGPQSAAVAFSHTAALADDDRIIQGACVQSGVLRATSFREMVEMAKALSLPPLKGKRLGIVSASGGAAIMAADTCRRLGMELADLPDSCLGRISSFPKAKVINLTNPVDTGTTYNNQANVEAIKLIMDLEEVDGGVLSVFHSRTGDYFEGTPAEEIVAEVGGFSRCIGKPVAVHFLCDPLTREELKTHADYPIFDTIEDAITALSYAWKHTSLRQDATQGEQPLGTSPRPPFVFDLPVPPDLAAFHLLAQHQIPCEHPVALADEEDLRSQADSLGYPVALKALSPDFTHKRARGAVCLNLGTRRELRQAFKHMSEILSGAQVYTYLLQKMVPPGLDLIIGGKRDPHYGPVVLFGQGGSLVEEVQEAICCLAPLSLDMAKNVLDQFPHLLLSKSLCYQPLAETLVRFSQLLIDNPHILEMDLNPVRAFLEEGWFTVLDVRVRLTPVEK